jgi:hypothetical protein
MEGVDVFNFLDLENIIDELDPNDELLMVLKRELIRLTKKIKKKTFTCFRCGEKGHHIKDCKKGFIDNNPFRPRGKWVQRRQN